MIFMEVLRLRRSEARLLIDIMLMTLYFGDPFDDLAVYPCHGRQVYLLAHDDMVIAIYRDSAWHEKVQALSAQGFA